jgi:hypothetical protein
MGMTRGESLTAFEIGYWEKINNECREQGED